MYCSRIIRTLFIIGVAAPLLGGCYDSGFSERDDGAAAEPATSTIRELCELYQGTPFVVGSDVVVSGRVTTSDSAGNFFRTFCIEQDGAGIEVMAGVDHLHNDYPVGCRVTLRLKGLALGQSYGVLQAGRTPAAGSGFATDYLGSKPALDAAVTRNGKELTPLSPTLLTLAEVTPAHCGTLVQIGGLRYDPDELGAATWAGYKRFTDASGAEIYTYVRSYAGFADKEVPIMSCTLRGILQRDATGNRFILKLRDEGDCVH